MELRRVDLDAHIRALRRYAIALTHNVADADDLVQETLRRALDYTGKDAQIEDWKAYLFKILLNVRNDQHARRAKSENSVPLDQLDADACVAPPAQHLHHECIRVGDAMEALCPEQREVLLLVALEGHSYREVADLLDVPVGTVMSRLGRARNSLRTVMGDGDEARVQER